MRLYLSLLGVIWFASTFAQTKVYNREKNGFLGDNILCFTKDQKGIFWIGSEKGISRIDFSKGGDEAKSSNRITRIPVTAIEEADDKYLWIGTLNKGMYVFNKFTYGLKPYRSDVFGDYIVERIWKVDDYMFIFSSEKGNYRVELSSGKISRVLDNIEYHDLYKPEKLLISKKGKVYRYSEGKFKIYNRVDNEHPIVSLAKDEKGNYWYGTVDKGVYEVVGKKRYNYNKADGLSNNRIDKIIATKQGKILFIGDKEITRYTEQYKALVRANLKLEGQINHQAVYEDANGDIWMATSKGLVVYFSGQDNKQSAAPGFKLVDVHEKGESIGVAANKRSERPFVDGDYEFFYQAEGLGDPEKVTIEYQLIGFDTEVQKKKFDGKPLYFENIGHGNRRLIIKACNQRGICTNEEEFKLIIRNPLEDSIIWYFIGGVAFILYTFLVYLISTNKHRKDIKVLEKDVLAKTEELNKYDKRLKNVDA